MKTTTRKFSSYGPVSTSSNYYVPREQLVSQAINQLLGTPPEEGGYYFTVWAPRQTGKSWIMQQAMARIHSNPDYYCVKVNLQVGCIGEDAVRAANYISHFTNRILNTALPEITDIQQWQEIFCEQYLDRPLVLILDEFDSLEPDTIQQLVAAFRNMYNGRKDALTTGTPMPFLLHGLCLIGVRSVLGVENVKGSPFNVQRSMHIPNLTFDEVAEMFAWYERESGQRVEPEVVERLYYETNGQPGITSWFGELLTERYNEHPEKPIGMKNWNRVFMLACHALPDNNILNIISKANDPRYKPTVLSLFNTEEKIPYSFDKPDINFLYMNGVVTHEEGDDGHLYTKFPSPYVQKRLFNRFSDEALPLVNTILDPFDEMEDAIQPDRLIVPNILKRFQKWLDREIPKEYFLKNAPRRSDLRVYEAVWHFAMYRYLAGSLSSWNIGVFPEFPTGNGKVDLILRYKEKQFPVEIKSYSNMPDYRTAIAQAARYAQTLGVERITLAFFIEAIDPENRARLECEITDETTGTTVEIVFLTTNPAPPS